MSSPQETWDALSSEMTGEELSAILIEKTMEILDPDPCYANGVMSINVAVNLAVVDLAREAARWRRKIYLPASITTHARETVRLLRQRT